MNGNLVLHENFDDANVRFAPGRPAAAGPLAAPLALAASMIAGPKSLCSQEAKLTGNSTESKGYRCSAATAASAEWAENPT